MGGCIGSSAAVNVVHHHHYQERLSQSLDGVVAPSDMPFFYQIFNKIDKDSSGNIEVNEFLDYVKLPRNSLLGKNVFKVFDGDVSHFARTYVRESASIFFVLTIIYYRSMFR